MWTLRCWVPYTPAQLRSFMMMEDNPQRLTLFPVQYALKIIAEEITIIKVNGVKVVLMRRFPNILIAIRVQFTNHVFLSFVQIQIYIWAHVVNTIKNTIFRICFSTYIGKCSWFSRENNLFFTSKQPRPSYQTAMIVRWRMLFDMMGGARWLYYKKRTSL